MSGFFWNVWGFNKSTKHSVVREWVKNCSFQFGCVLETMVKETKALRVSSKVFRIGLSCQTMSLIVLEGSGLYGALKFECYHVSKVLKWLPAPFYWKAQKRSFSAASFTLQILWKKGKNYGMISNIIKILHYLEINHG